MAQEMTRTPPPGGGLVGLISIANGSGRLLWAWLSDFTGRRGLVAMSSCRPWPSCCCRALRACAAWPSRLRVLLCYGGGFGTMPAFAADSSARQRRIDLR